MSPTPTPSPSPSPVFREDDGFIVQPGYDLREALIQQKGIADEMNSHSTSTMTQDQFNSLMDGQPSHNTAAPIAAIVLSVLVLTAAAVAFLRHRRRNSTSPAPAPAEATP